MRLVIIALAICGCVGGLTSSRGSFSIKKTVPSSAGLLSRRYREGETLSYKMKATNKERGKTHAYEAQACGIVKKDSTGNFYEEYQWFDVVWDGKAVAVPPNFRQILSLDPTFKPAFPDLRNAPSGLVGPVLDLMTFYVDLAMAIRYRLNRAGDHVYVKFGRPSSWSTGEGAILGESSIDFDITLQGIDRAANTATLLVRHVPPAQSQIQLPAAWMRKRVVDTGDNWVSVTKGPDGKYVAAVGKETFDDIIRISLTDGHILSATMDNPVEVLERECDDAALTACGRPTRYEIRRQAAIE